MNLGLVLDLKLTPHPKTVPCHTCGALAGEACKTVKVDAKWQRAHGSHKPRIAAAKEKGGSDGTG